MSALEALLLAGLLFLSGITLVLLRNFFQFSNLKSEKRSDDSELSVGVCIPARNEENNIRKCMDHALSQSYDNFHIYVLNDRSTDQTGEILQTYKRVHESRLTILEGESRPKGWLGKPWACHQLSKAASTHDIMLFVDADTWMHPETIYKLVGTFNRKNVDFITVWPEQKLQTTWEKILVPLVYYALLGFLPVAYTERKPRWMPELFHKRFRNLFAAACGQFMAFRKETYRQIDGHETVKNDIVEDVGLAREVLDHGFRMKMYSGVGSVSCRMYTSEKELFEGFRKNFLAGFDYNIPLFIMMAFLHLITFILPFIILLIVPFWDFPPIVILLTLLNITFIFLHRMILAGWMNWDISYSVTHVIGVGWFQRLGIVTLIDYFTNRDISWKGDAIKHSDDKANPD
ncbi:MAG: glycosyltransferase family 2 protein [Balneolales bacterium]|nr:glycosyltransferase family 2 protein [Balneolales bacterium]